MFYAHSSTCIEKVARAFKIYDRFCFRFSVFLFLYFFKIIGDRKFVMKCGNFGGWNKRKLYIRLQEKTDSGTLYLSWGIELLKSATAPEHDENAANSSPISDRRYNTARVLAITKPTTTQKCQGTPLLFTRFGKSTIVPKLCKLECGNFTHAHGRFPGLDCNGLVCYTCNSGV
jgi:hypothetical protein